MKIKNHSTLLQASLLLFLVMFAVAGAQAAGTVAKLIWTSQPAGVTNSLVFGQGPVIKTADATGTPSTVGLPAVKIIQVGLYSGNGTLTGMLTANIGTAGGNGTITLTNLQISAPGTARMIAFDTGNGSTPLNLTAAANCQLWLDAADLNTFTLSGSAVTIWGDKSGKNNNAASGTAPVLANNSILAATPSGLSQVVRFDGASTYFNVDLSSLGDSPYTIVMMEVGSSKTSGSSYMIGNSGGNSTDLTLHCGYNSTAQWRWGQYGDDLNYSAAFTFPVPRVWTEKINASRGETLYLDSTNVGTRTAGGFLNGSYLNQGTVGAGLGGNNYQGDLAELMVFNTALSDQDRTNLENYLLTKWGTGLSSATSSNFNVLRSDGSIYVTLTTGVYRELWTNLNSSLGNTLVALTNTTYNPNWPNNPAGNYTTVYTNFEAPINTGMTYYGQRMRAFVVPPVTGNYTFWIASDDSSQLFLSTDENPTDKTLIAQVIGGSGAQTWNTQANQQSVPITLQAGCRYYLEAIMQQSTGSDDLEVRWQLPNGAIEEPMTGSSAAGTVMIPCNGMDIMPGIYRQSTNTTAVEESSFVLSVLAANESPLTYQWRLNGTNLASATKAVFPITNASLAINNGQIYSCVVSDVSGSVTSAPIVLTITQDTTPPTITRVQNIGTTNVQLLFSEPLAMAGATSPANFVFTNGTTVSSAQLDPSGTLVTLTTSPLTYGSNYWIVINNVHDLAATPNTIATNTTVVLFASIYASEDIGNPPLSTVTPAGNGINVVATGSDIGGTADQFNFNNYSQTGDFDVAARVAGLSLSDIWAKAGLMARETLDPLGRFAAALTTPTMNGSSFAWRDPAGSTASTTGNFPANYPNTWLRLKRTGDTFSGFAGYDGQTWTLLGSVTISMSNQVYLGFCVSSHGTNLATTAQFRDFTNVTSATLGTQTNPHDLIGASSRKTPIVFSEIMYKPASRTDGKNVEFVEIYNSNPWFQDISSYQITCADMNYTFPPNTIIPGGGYLVIAAAPADIQSVYGITNVTGPYTGSLKKTETLELFDEQGALLLTVPFSNIYPWPVAADGTGHSIVLASPTYGEGDPRAWDISDVEGGSPGQMDGFTPSPLRSVVINEYLAHTDPPEYDYIELYNHSTNSVDISGCVLTDDPTTNKFIIPNGTIMAPHGFVFYSETNMNFALNATGESIYFIKPDGSRILDAVQFQDQQNGVASGRWPDGANDFYRLSSLTPGGSNAPILLSDIVINELMYDPISENDDDQYIELYNRSTNTINMGGWKLTNAVSFTFSTNTTVAPGGYLVVGRNQMNLFSKYPNLNTGNTVGNFSGKLSHNGEYLALTMPAEHKTTDSHGNTVTNIINIVVNDVTYGTGGRWGEWAGGGGSSLELKNPNSNNRLAANWADSDETAKSVWTNIETTAVLDNGANYDASIDRAQIGILDVGECLVDNIEVDYNGSNYVSNGTFETGTNGWAFQGCHARSSLENTGYAGTHSLHMRSSDHFWTGDNSCQVVLNANTIASGQTATLRFKARWLRGWPEAILRLNGNWLEAAGAMPLPNNLGSPGMPNSCYVTNAGPAIYNVTHFPVIPAASQPVVVTAQAHDAGGLQNMMLYYRLDPSTSYTPVLMKDDGTGGDAIAGDGIYSATIPGQAANQVVAFFITAADTQLVATRFPALRPSDNEPARECVLMFGDGTQGGSFKDLHLWITQSNANRWTSLGDMSNEGNDCTIAFGNRVVYNAQGRFAGSPYHQSFDSPYGSPCHYKWTFPDDDEYLGATSFNKIHQPGNYAGDDTTIQREQLANYLLRSLGVPWLNRHYVAVYVNGNRRGTLMEDAQCPDGDKMKENYPNDADGFLFKMQPWFEFAPALSGVSMSDDNESWCTLNNYTTTGGVKKTARYRYNYLMRRTPDSASDYSKIFALVDAANTYGTPNYVANLENVADMENWMRVFAANHAAGNWDSFGAQNGQNLYGYAGTLGTKYSLQMFDFNIVFGDDNNFSWAPGQNLFTVDGSDAPMGNIYNTPVFRRMYWRALQELVNGPLNVANSGPLLDAKYNTFVANGLSVEDPNLNLKPWVSQAQSSIATQLAAANTTNFTVTSVVVNGNVANLTGTAPVNAQTIWINGAAWPVTWTSVTGWTATVPLKNGTNLLNVVGVDTHGNPIAGQTNGVSAVYNGTVPSPAGQVVINEIMYSPAVTNAQFVELYNTSSNVAFDLSGCDFHGLSYTFPAGSFIGPTNYLVLAADRAGFASAYGTAIPVFDEFDGTVSANGETLSLLQPATNGDLTITKVKYENTLPWPTNANTPGYSLQLIDPNQDNWREGNWAAVQTNAPVVPQWVHVTATGTASSSTFYIYLQSAGDVYVDDVYLVAGSVPEVGVNTLTNGNFETAFPGPWTVSANLSGSAVSTAVKHSGNASLHVVASAGGTTQSSAIWQTISPALTSGAAYTLSFWYLQNTNGGPLTLRLSGSGVVANVNPAPPSITNSQSTPDAINSVAAALPPFPSLWINELQADNLTGITNRAGQRTAWLELYNPGTNAVSLNGLYLANNYTNLLQWTFPTNAVVNPGQFKVIFADGLTNLTTTNEPHASFTLASGTGSLALSRLYANQPQVLDYVNYANVGLNHSYGSYPDGQSFTREEFFLATPGAANDNDIPLTLSINEWMAGNTHPLQDPLDSNNYDDWFELYNYGDLPVDPAGCYLTNALGGMVGPASQIPPGYTIPAHGFLLVWADKKNPTGSGDMHANFKLSKSGTSIVLYDPNENLLDYVTFGAQTSDVSMGRYPDASTNIVFMVTPTPRTNNIYNTAPVLAAINSISLLLGQTLTFSASATDSDQPAQTLTFTLGPGAPASAAILAGGLFSWTPTNAPSTNVISVIVTDTGTPPLTATQSFTVVVYQPPQLGAVSVISGGQFTLSWQAAAGQNYQIEYKDNLTDASWMPLGSPIPGDDFD